jgi:hypothetical protein
MSYGFKQIIGLIRLTNLQTQNLSNGEKLFYLR